MLGNAFKKVLTAALAVQATAGASLRGAEESQETGLPCPAANSLAFAQLNPYINNGVVVISGTYNDTDFISNNLAPGEPAHTVVHPATAGVNGTVGNATLTGFNGVDNSCLYTYPDFVNQTAHLVMAPAQAQAAAPACPTELEFTQVDPAVPEGMVVITGTNAANQAYVSENDQGGETYIHPMTAGTNGTVTANSTGSLNSLCYYLYQGFTGEDVHLTMAPERN